MTDRPDIVLSGPQGLTCVLFARNAPARSVWPARIAALGVAAVIALALPAVSTPGAEASPRPEQRLSGASVSGDSRADAGDLVIGDRAPRGYATDPEPSRTRLAIIPSGGGEEARLTLQQCRELLPPGTEITDQQLERMRDEMYALAEVTLDVALGSRLRSR